jgi:hypothetical protein
MNVIRSRIIVFVVLLAAHTTTAAQPESPERLILNRTVAVMQKMHPEWDFVPTICSGCSPITDEQVGEAGGTWQRTAPDQSITSVSIYRVKTADSVGRLLERLNSTERAGWTVRPYKFGDGATMASYPDPRGFTQYNMYFGKGQFFVSLSARSQETIEMFAQSVLTAISN